MITFHLCLMQTKPITNYEFCVRNHIEYNVLTCTLKIYRLYQLVTITCTNTKSRENLLTFNVVLFHVKVILNKC